MKKKTDLILLFTVCILIIIPLLISLKPVINPWDEHWYPQLYTIGDTQGITVKHKTELSYKGHNYKDYNTETWIFKNNSSQDKSFQIAYQTMDFNPFYIDGEEQKMHFYYYTGDIVDQDIVNGTYAEKMKTGWYLRDFNVTPEELGLDEKAVLYEFEFYPDNEEQYENMQAVGRAVTVRFSYDPEKTKVYHQFYGEDGICEVSINKNAKTNKNDVEARLGLFDCWGPNDFFQIEEKNIIIVTGEDIGESAIHISPVALNNGETFTGRVVRREMTIKEALDLITEYRYTNVDEEFDPEKEIQGIKSAVYRSFAEFRENGYVEANIHAWSWSISEPEEFSNIRIIYERVIGRGLPRNHREFSLAEVSVPAGEEVTVTVKTSSDLSMPGMYSKEGTRLNILPPQESDLVYESYEFSIDLNGKPVSVFIAQNMGLKKTGDGVKSASLDPYYDGYYLTFSGQSSYKG